MAAVLKTQRKNEMAAVLKQRLFLNQQSRLLQRAVQTVTEGSSDCCGGLRRRKSARLQRPFFIIIFEVILLQGPRGSQGICVYA